MVDEGNLTFIAEVEMFLSAKEKKAALLLSKQLFHMCYLQQLSTVD